MYWIIGIIGFLTFNVFGFAFIYGAGKQNKAFDDAMEELNKCPKPKKRQTTHRIGIIESTNGRK